MCKRLFVSIAFSLLILSCIGCSERYGGSMYPIPTIPDERPSNNPSEDDVIDDLKDFYSDIVSAELVEEVHSIESHVYFVKVERDGDVAMWFKVTYYFVDGQWVCIPDQIEI